MINGKSCGQHFWIVTEWETDGNARAQRAHKLMCARCTLLISYREILKLQVKTNTIDGELAEPIK